MVCCLLKRVHEFITVGHPFMDENMTYYKDEKSIYITKLFQNLNQTLSKKKIFNQPMFSLPHHANAYNILVLWHE